MKKTIDTFELAEKYDLNYTGKQKIFTSGKGCRIYDDSGKEYIDFSEITGNIGHSHPKFISKIEEELQKFSVEKSVISPNKSDLLKRICEKTNMDKAFLVSSGSEAVDWAIKLARRFTGKHEIISFWNGLHGRSYASSNLTGLSARKKNFGPAIPGILFSPYGDCVHCAFEKEFKTCNFFCINFLDKMLKTSSTNDVAAIIFEPYQGLGGMIFPPKGYLKKLVDWAKSRDILVIIDEVQSGYGRTGKFIASEWEELNPDILTLGKGMGNGFHIAALLTKKDIAASIDGVELSGGSGGNNIAVAASLAVLDIIEDEELCENSEKIGNFLLKELHKLKMEFNIIKDVRGQGLAIGIEFEDSFNVKNIVEEGYLRGLYLQGKNNLILLRPPLSINLNEAKLFLKGLKDILSKLGGNK